MTRLSVNLNKIALVRNARNFGAPSILKAARVAVENGAYGITVHPRPDQRHIRYSDLYEIKALGLNAEFNIEGNPFEGKFMEVMPDILPNQATLVPDEHGQLTSDHGWQLNDKNCQKLKPVIEKLKSLGIRVSLFVDPDTKTIETAKKIGADRIELYTEPYARCFENKKNLEALVEKFAKAASNANEIGLGVNAGHDLNLDNLGLFCQNVKPVAEVSIGHALICDALYMGLENAVKAYCKILEETKN